jgi:protein-tyrosine-phosphatase
MAEAIFNKLRPKGWQAISAGTRPAPSVNPFVVQVIAEIGIDATKNRPKPISTDMIAKAERIITMGCAASGFCPARYLPKVEEWEIEDPHGKSLERVRLIRESIRERVKGLLRELQGL